MAKYLLDIPEKEFNEAIDFFRTHPQLVKMPKKDKKSHSFIKVGDEVYALNKGEYLGEGAYGKVKIVQNQMGHNFAVKIEGNQEAQAEEKIAKAIGYLKGKGVRALSQEQTFKGSKISEKSYTVMELKEGKELFQQLYSSNILLKKPGYLYEVDELKRKKGTSQLSDAQKLLIAIKCAQAINDLHHRRIIHGDIKPANFMANVKGEQITIGAIDFGFSFQLNATENVITHSQIPRGTPEHYLPPEVLTGKTAQAQYSFGSDIYSLGKMFEHDLQLPQEIYLDMIKADPTKRASLSEIMAHLADELEKLPAQEKTQAVIQVIKEIKEGVKPIGEEQGAQLHQTFIAQLMSSFRDPREMVNNPALSVYTTKDFAVLASSIYAYIPPGDFEKIAKDQDGKEIFNADRSKQVIKKEGFFTQLIKAYSDLKNDTDKETFLHNSQLFIEALIKADPHQEFLAGTKQGIDRFLEIGILEPNKESKAIKEVFSQMQENLDKAIEVSQQRKDQLDDNLQKSVTREPGTLDIDNFIHQSLIKSDHHLNRNAKSLADDFKQQQLNHLKQINPSEFHNQNYEKKKELKSSFNDMSELFNQISTVMQNDILSAKSKSHQKRIYQFYVKVEREALKNGDFCTAMALQSAFNNTTISRLAYLSKGQSRKTKTIFKQDSQVLSIENGNRAILQEMEKRVNRGESIVPYLPAVGGTLTALTSNPTSHPRSGKENEALIGGFGKEIHALMQAQSKAYAEPVNNLQTTLQEKLAQKLPDEKELYAKSKILLANKNEKPSFPEESKKKSFLLGARRIFRKSKAKSEVLKSTSSVGVDREAQMNKQPLPAGAVDPLAENLTSPDVKDTKEVVSTPEVKDTKEAISTSEVKDTKEAISTSDVKDTKEVISTSEVKPIIVENAGFSENRQDVEVLEAKKEEKKVVEKGEEKKGEEERKEAVTAQPISSEIKEVKSAEVVEKGTSKFKQTKDFWEKQAIMGMEKPPARVSRAKPILNSFQQRAEGANNQVEKINSKPESNPKSRPL